jgi:AraC family transcriptional regulator of adaptative response / DNA-3-methyladenine glycosylase II
MELDPDVCYRALRTRDARFDGRFFTAVRSTGVYCRPVCPARTPKPENCRFLPCAAAAQEAGFRPCRRCRPESAPGTAAWLGTSATVSRALRLIGEGALDSGSGHELAARLGIGERHLRRLFLQHLGASPVAVAQTRRVFFAAKLLEETDLPIAQVAFSSGFSSIRRFNDAIRSTFRLPPRELRRARRRPACRSGPGVSLKLPYRPPLDWDALLRFFALRAIPGVERVASGCYVRTIRCGDTHGIVEVSASLEENALRARLQLSGPAPLIGVAERLRQLFDLGADPREICAHLGADPGLARVIDASPGLRVPGAWDGFELAVRAILGQQISVRAASTFAGRLVAAHGEPVEIAEPDTPNGAPRLLFPRPETLASADLTAIGLTRARARAISTLSAEVASGALVLGPGRDPESVRRQLESLDGVGPWTAEYVAMRSLREPDAFPATDLGLRRALGTSLSAAELTRRAEAWRPWRAYAAVALWSSIA